jgi:putative chitinase
VWGVFPSANAAWLTRIFTIAPTCGIDTPNEMASFLAQFGHETAGFTRFEENLSYSAARLMQVWPNRFPDLRIAQEYERNPKMLAEKVYGGRMWNNLPGDGWMYRGRGPQLTGKRNYCKASVLVDMNLVGQPDLMLDPAVGVLVACKGWQAWKLDRYDDDADARAESVIINGGEVGLRERQRLLDALLKVLA